MLTSVQACPGPDLLQAGPLVHWRQPRRGCRGHIPEYFGWGDVNGNIPQYFYVLSDIPDQYCLPSVRSASSRFHLAIRRHQFASVSSHTPPHSVVRPPNLELALTPLQMPNPQPSNPLNAFSCASFAHRCVRLYYIYSLTSCPQ